MHLNTIEQTETKEMRKRKWKSNGKRWISKEAAVNFSCPPVYHGKLKKIRIFVRKNILINGKRIPANFSFSRKLPFAQLI